jgi:hypothetical protein
VTFCAVRSALRISRASDGAVSFFSCNNAYDWTEMNRRARPVGGVCNHNRVAKSENGRRKPRRLINRGGRPRMRAPRRTVPTLGNRQESAWLMRMLLSAIERPRSDRCMWSRHYVGRR